MAMESEVDVLDTSIREAREWIEDVARETGLDRQRAFAALRAVLHAIRDETTARQSAAFVSEMPAPIRGLYFEGWHPGRDRDAEQSRDRFVQRVRASIGDHSGGEDDLRIVRGVFRVLERRMPVPSAKVRRLLSRELRAVWPEPIADHVAERQQRLAAEKREATYEALHAEAGHERGAPLAPHQNRAPGELHRGGPLPNQM